MTRTSKEKLALANEFVLLLNSAVELDKDAIHKLAEFRVRCNAALAQHPTVQVRTSKESNSTGAAALVDVHRVGLLGILNGLLGVDEFGQAYLAGSYDDAGKLTHFSLNANLGKPRV